MKYHYQREIEGKGEEKPQIVEGDTLGPVLPAGLGMLKINLQQVLFIVLVLVISFWVSQKYVASIREARIMAQAEAECQELSVRFTKMYWDSDQELCLWQLTDDSKKQIAER